jgi:hypothetical protein
LVSEKKNDEWLSFACRWASYLLFKHCWVFLEINVRVKFMKEWPKHSCLTKTKQKMMFILKNQGYDRELTNLLSLRLSVPFSQS